jgi:hypothetical protein
VWNNETLKLGDSSTGGFCQPQIGGSYKWEFSFLLAFICIMLLIVWTVGTFLMWMKATIAMRQHDDREIAGGYKAVVELATTMDSQFSKQEEDVAKMRDGQVRSRIKQDLKGGSMVYEAPHREIQSSMWNILMLCKKWLWKDKWWLFAIITMLI